MSGHSKWATIKRHKASVDAKRGKAFSVIGKEIMISVRSAGSDPEFNNRLRMLIRKAKAANMPAENIERAIKKGSGELPGQIIEEINYEGYAPGGVGVIIQTTTDNKTRTSSEVRSVFNKMGGNLAGSGALAFNFTRKGQFLIPKGTLTEEMLLEIVLDAGAEDINVHEDHFEVISPVVAFDKVSCALHDASIEVTESELVFLPNSTIEIIDADIAKKVLRLIDLLEDLEDVNHVFSNFEIDDALIEASQK